MPTEISHSDPEGTSAQPRPIARVVFELAENIEALGDEVSLLESLEECDDPEAGDSPRSRASMEALLRYYDERGHWERAGVTNNQAIPELVDRRILACERCLKELTGLETGRAPVRNAVNRLLADLHDFYTELSNAWQSGLLRLAEHDAHSPNDASGAAPVMLERTTFAGAWHRVLPAFQQLRDTLTPELRALLTLRDILNAAKKFDSDTPNSLSPPRYIAEVFAPEFRNSVTQVGPLGIGLTLGSDVHDMSGLELAFHAGELLRDLRSQVGALEPPLDSSSARPTERARTAGDRSAEGAASESRVKSPQTSDAPKNEFRRVGGYWKIRFEGMETSIEDRVGLSYIRHLLARPSQSFTPSDLKATRASEQCDRETRTRAGTEEATDKLRHGELSHVQNAGEIIDKVGLKRIKDELDAIGTELDQARKNNDEGEEKKLESKREKLRQELRSAFEKHGPRRLQDEVKRDRQAVNKAIKGALEKIQNIHAPLWAHLDRALTLGAELCYRPDSGCSW